MDFSSDCVASKQQSSSVTGLEVDSKDSCWVWSSSLSMSTGSCLNTSRIPGMTLGDKTASGSFNAAHAGDELLMSSRTVM